MSTKHPFEGIIHGPDREESGCSVVGRGGTKTTLTIPLGGKKAGGEAGACGVRYNQVSLTEKHCFSQKKNNKSRISFSL